MGWKERCYAAMDEARLFESSAHRTRFKELMDCYSGYPFFSKGLCKCMYLSAWDEEHFAIMLEMLMNMALGKDHDTTEMQVNGESLAEEETGGEQQIYLLSCALLEGYIYIPKHLDRLSPDVQYIFRRAIEAAEVIDGVE